jgi:Cu/Ag efflux protein CusF
MHPTIRLSAAGALAVLAAAAYSQDKAAAKPPAPASAYAGAPRATATVQSVDQATRKVTLKDEQGRIVSFVASAGVRNLGEIGVGDVVTLENTERIAQRMGKSDAKVPSRTEAVSLQHAPAGQAPSGSITREITLVGSVEAVDLRKRMVTVRGADEAVMVKVADPAMLKAVKVGDMVDTFYVEVVRMKVDKAPAKK